MLKKYQPLLVLVAIAILGALALTYSTQKGLFGWMHFFMGLFFCLFAQLKLFHINGFAEGFKKYDLLSKQWPPYAKIYPFIELLLGLSYLSFSYLTATYIVTFLLMSFGAIGVILALKKGLDLRCACMGTVLNVPLSTVTLSEDIVMALMALSMLLTHL